MLLRTILSVLLGFNSVQWTPSDYWNDFVHDYGMRDLEDVEPEMRGEFLAYWYFSEVYNGGHLQYFLNKHDFPWEETADAMEAMGAEGHAKILREAIEIWRAEERRAAETVDEYVEEAEKDELGDLDSAMYKLEPMLEYYLDRSLVRKARQKGK